jgi:hypothetical protein
MVYNVYNYLKVNAMKIFAIPMPEIAAKKLDEYCKGRRISYAMAIREVIYTLLKIKDSPAMKPGPKMKGKTKNG